MSRVKPILFNTDMVRMILDGRKTVTRRIVKSKCKGGEILDEKPPYQPGDTLYVKETWQYMYDLDGNDQIIEETGCYVYAADNFAVDTWVNPDGTHRFGIPWKPSIHMPKEAARIWLKVTDVRVERLQDITPAEVVREGAYPDCWECLDSYGNGSQCCYKQDDECSQCDSTIQEWEKLWNSTIKKSDLDRYGWDANPYVWVIEFERCEKPKGV